MLLFFLRCPYAPSRGLGRPPNCAGQALLHCRQAQRIPVCKICTGISSCVISMESTQCSALPSPAAGAWNATSLCMQRHYARHSAPTPDACCRRAPPSPSVAHAAAPGTPCQSSGGPCRTCFRSSCKRSPSRRLRGSRSAAAQPPAPQTMTGRPRGISAWRYRADWGRLLCVRVYCCLRAAAAESTHPKHLARTRVHRQEDCLRNDALCNSAVEA